MIIDLNEEIFEVTIKKVNVDALFVTLGLYQQITSVIKGQIYICGGLFALVYQGEFLTMSIFVHNGLTKVNGEDFYPSGMEELLSFNCH